MADLSKMFVLVPQEKVSTFKSKYYSPLEGATRSDAYDKKIVFLGSSGEIFTQGQLYGNTSASDIAQLLADVAKLNGADTVEGSVAKQIKDAIALVVDDAPEAFDTLKEIAVWLENDSNKNAADILTEIGTPGSDAVTAVEGNIWQEGGIYKKVGEEYVKIQEVSELVAGETYYYSEDGGTSWQVSREASATANVSELGKDQDDNSWYGYRVPVSAADAVEATGLYKKIEEAKAAAIASQHAKTTVTTSTTNGAVKVDGVDVSVNETQLSVKSGSENYVAVSGHQVEIKTTNLGDAVGLTKVTEGENAGKYVSADGTLTNSGLATAADIAAEIIADEKVIAIALNDHEARVKANEDAIGVPSSAAVGTEGEEGYVAAVEATGLYKAIETAKSDLSHAKTTVVDGSEAGKLKIDGTDVEISAFDAAGAASAVQGETTATVKSLEDVIGVASQAESAEGAGDAVVATGLQARIEAIEEWNMWETYSPTAD